MRTMRQTNRFGAALVLVLAAHLAPAWAQADAVARIMCNDNDGKRAWLFHSAHKEGHFTGLQDCHLQAVYERGLSGLVEASVGRDQGEAYSGLHVGDVLYFHVADAKPGDQTTLSIRVGLKALIYDDPNLVGRIKLRWCIGVDRNGQCRDSLSEPYLRLLSLPPAVNVLRGTHGKAAFKGAQETHYGRTENLTILGGDAEVPVLYLLETATKSVGLPSSHTSAYLYWQVNMPEGVTCTARSGRWGLGRACNRAAQ